MKKKKEKSSHKKSPPQAVRNKKQIDESILEQRKQERNGHLIFLFGNNETSDLKAKSESIQREVKDRLDKFKECGCPDTFAKLIYALVKISFILISKEWDKIVELIISEHATIEQSKDINSVLTALADARYHMLTFSYPISFSRLTDGPNYLYPGIDVSLPTDLLKQQIGEVIDSYREKLKQKKPWDYYTGFTDIPRSVKGKKVRTLENSMGIWSKCLEVYALKKKNVKEKVIIQEVYHHTKKDNLDNSYLSYKSQVSQRYEEAINKYIPAALRGEFPPSKSFRIR